MLFLQNVEDNPVVEKKFQQVNPLAQRLRRWYLRLDTQHLPLLRDGHGHGDRPSNADEGGGGRVTWAQRKVSLSSATCMNDPGTDDTDCL